MEESSCKRCKSNSHLTNQYGLSHEGVREEVSTWLVVQAAEEMPESPKTSTGLLKINLMFDLTS